MGIRGLVERVGHMPRSYAIEKFENERSGRSWYDWCSAVKVLLVWLVRCVKRQVRNVPVRWNLCFMQEAIRFSMQQRAIETIASKEGQWTMLMYMGLFTDNVGNMIQTKAVICNGEQYTQRKVLSNGKKHCGPLIRLDSLVCSLTAIHFFVTRHWMARTVPSPSQEARLNRTEQTLPGLLLSKPEPASQESDFTPGKYM